MEALPLTDDPLKGAQALAAYLRENPDAIHQGPQELAQRFGLPPSVVRQVTEGFQPPPRPKTAPRESPILAALARARTSLDRSFRAATKNPIRFLAVTLLICVLLVATIPQVSARMETGPAATSVVRIAGGVMVLVVILLTWLLHLACFYVNRMVRYALYGGLILWVVLAPLLMILTWFQADRPEDIGTFTQIVLIALTVLFFAGFYSGVGALTAVAGNYMHFRRMERMRREMTRQELLERYFDLQERRRTAAMPAPEQVVPLHPAIESYRRAEMFWSFLVGLSLGVLLVGISAAANFNPTETASPQQALPALLVAILGFSGMLIYIPVGYFGTSGLKALLASLCMSLGSWLSTWIPLGPFGPSYALSGSNFAATLLTTPFMVFISMAAFVGAQLQRRAAQERSLQENDPDAILAEMIRVQMQLGEEANAVCVMVVDVAKSTQMKAGADPLAVEYSFREYQEWVEEVCLKHGGRVHSTAGDGAVIAFNDCPSAFQAARRLQTGVLEFNRRTNRLKTPFRLRIGLHLGQVAGDLDKVKFTEVIDIAAHVESAAPVGGIMMTAAVAAHLPDESLAPLREPVDGLEVVVALQPTLIE